MARAIWSGVLTFGLVNVPVQLYAATEDKMIHFRQFERGTSSRIRYRRVNEDTGDEVDYEDIVKGFRADSGEYVLLEPRELEEIAPGRSRTIEITDFVQGEQIDPIYFQKSYYLAPSRDDAERAYQLLNEAMADTGRIAIANFVMRSRQYLAAVRAQEGVLVLETMYFADEVRNPSDELNHVPAHTEPTTRDLDMAVSLIDSMTVEWDPSNYADTYREKVLDLVQSKARGEGLIAPGDEEGTSAEVVDLHSALRRSVRSSGKHRPGNRHQGGSVATTPRRGKSSSAPKKNSSPSGSAKSGRARSTQKSSNLAGKSKQELYDLAREHGISGRSGMTKSQLADAISKAPRKRKRAS